MSPPLQLDKATIRSLLLAGVEILLASPAFLELAGPILAAALAPKLAAMAAAAPAEPRRGRGRPLAASSGCSKRDAKRERDRASLAARRAAGRPHADNSTPTNPVSELSPSICRRPQTPPAPARPVSEISSLSVSSEKSEKSKRETPSGISLPSLEGGADKSLPTSQSGYPTPTHTKRPGALTLAEALLAYEEEVRQVLPGWQPLGDPRAHRDGVRELCSAALRQHPSEDSVGNERTLRYNVGRYITALRASSLHHKSYDGAAAHRWLNEHGYEAAPRPIPKPAPPPPLDPAAPSRPAVVKVDRRRVAEAMAAAEELIRVVNGPRSENDGEQPRRAAE